MQLLKDVRVLDLTRLYPGPFCTMMMADMGAEVIKIESPGEGDYMRKMGPVTGEDSVYFQLLNRSKKSMTLNLKAEEGVRILLRLAEQADVVVEGFRPGVVDSLGIGYNDIRRVNPEIVYCSITGYGQDGPLKDRAGHDINYIALAGILGITGNAGGPPVVPGVQIGDVGGGAQMALAAILAALYAREKGRGGAYIDAAMLDGLVSWLPLPMAEVFAGGGVERGESALNGGLACYGVYRTADDGYMSLGALEKKFWVDFCQAVGREDLRERQYQRDQDALRQEVAAVFAGKSRKEWEAVFSRADACCEPVLSLPEVAEHPQVRARGMMSGASIGFPIKFKGQKAAAEGRSPRMGEHTDMLLCESGYSQQEVELLRNKGVV